MSRRTAASAVLLGVLLVTTGCRIDLVAEVDLDARGGGTFAVATRVDGSTLRELDALGVDPGADVALALDPALGWRAERVVDADGGLTVTHRRTFADGVGLAALLAELSDGLASEDPALRLDLDIELGRRGEVDVAGTATVSPPRTTGVLLDGVPLGPADAELAALTAAAVRAVLVIAVPGRVVAHDADRIDGRRLEWDVPVGSVRSVTLVADAPSPLARVPWWGWLLAAAAGAAGARGTVVSLGRRRDRSGTDGAGPDGSGAPSGPVSPAG